MCPGCPFPLDGGGVINNRRANVRLARTTAMKWRRKRRAALRGSEG